MAKKSTDAEIEKRVSDVYNLLLLGTSRPAILQYASKWSISPRSVDSIIRRAKAEIKKHAAVDRDDSLGTARARLEMLFQKTVAEKDYRGALAVQKELNALADLYPADEATLKRLLAQSGLTGVALILEVLEALDENGMNGQEIFSKMRDRLQEKDKTK